MAQQSAVILQILVFQIAHHCLRLIAINTLIARQWSSVRTGSSGAWKFLLKCRMLVGIKEKTLPKNIRLHTCSTLICIFQAPIHLPALVEPFLEYLLSLFQFQNLTGVPLLSEAVPKFHTYHNKITLQFHCQFCYFQCSKS